jgi:2-keto-4-pentenoate hydratase/2-oxohepta-3-ene-1,7-dioic acid hydratase in catechol pathway
MGIAKSYDTFCPIGPCMITEIPAAPLNIQCFLNGEQKQNGFTDKMIFSIPQLVSFISTVMILYPGDLILTGTPAGPGTLQNGDTVEVGGGTHRTHRFFAQPGAVITEKDRRLCRKGRQDARHLRGKITA